MNAGNGHRLGEILAAVEKKAAFTSWRKDNKKAFLTSAFTMVSSAEQILEGKEWLFSYYDTADDTFTTFSSEGAQKATKEQAFKEGETLPALNLSTIKVEAAGCINKAEELKNKEYKGQQASKIIAILQPLRSDEITGSSQKSKESPSAITVWNLTYITTAYNVINVKIDAASGNVLSHKMSGVMDFMNKDK